MDRRTFLMGVGSAATVATAGCVGKVTGDSPYDVVNVTVLCRDDIRFHYNADWGLNTESVNEVIESPTEGYGPIWYEDDEKPNSVSLTVERESYGRGGKLLAAIGAIEDFNGEYDWKDLDVAESSRSGATLSVSAKLSEDGLL